MTDAPLSRQNNSKNCVLDTNICTYYNNEHTYAISNRRISMRKGTKRGEHWKDYFYMVVLTVIGSMMLQVAVGTKEALELALR